MPYKDPIIRAAKNKTYNLTWYEENKERHKANAKATRKRNRDLWNEFKLSLECAQCGFKHPAAIDFHHLDPSEPKRGRLINSLALAVLKKHMQKLKSVYPYVLIATGFCIGTKAENKIFNLIYKGITKWNLR
jgi:ribosomal protein L44E